MRPLDEALTLSLADETAPLAPVDRAVRMLASLEGIDADAAADWRVDARDRALIEARRRAFGSEAAFFTRCSGCGEGVEGALDLDALLALPVAESPGLRAPTSRDVAAAARSGEPRRLLEACVESDAALPADAEALERALEKAFPLLDVRLALDCPACGTALAPRFDIGAYLCAEIDRRAAALLDEVHALAAAYGWREAEIVALPPRRRRAYLARIAA